MLARVVTMVNTVAEECQLEKRETEQDNSALSHDGARSGQAVPAPIKGLPALGSPLSTL